jgi:hypothetical protein
MRRFAIRLGIPLLVLRSASRTGARRWRIPLKDL